eukprot:gene17090-biopygen12787
MGYRWWGRGYAAQTIQRAGLDQATQAIGWDGQVCRRMFREAGDERHRRVLEHPRCAVAGTVLTLCDAPLHGARQPREAQWNQALLALVVAVHDVGDVQEEIRES